MAIDDWRGGGQANAVVRLADNNGDYRLGDKAELHGWAMKRFTDWLSGSVRIDVSHQGKTTVKTPICRAGTNRPDKFSEAFCQSVARCNLIGQSGVLANHRLAIEWSAPFIGTLWRVWNGKTLMIGWQKAF